MNVVGFTTKRPKDTKVSDNFFMNFVLFAAFVRVPDGSRGDIKGKGVWENGKWQVEMTRQLDTGQPDDKALRHLRRYSIAFAVHKDYTGSRWHYVSLPFSRGMGTDADIVARKFEGAEPPWNEIPWTTIPLFYPGQVTWDWLVSHAHAGAAELLNGQSCAACHTAELLGQYAAEHEQRDEISRRWYLTLASGLIFVTGLALTGVLVGRRRT